MNHHHTHTHHHSHHTNTKTLAWCLCIISIFMIIEAVAGKHFNSLTLIADAGHMANDAFALGISLASLLVATYSQQLSRALTILNALSLMVVALFIIITALYRLGNPVPIAGLPMIIIAGLGLLVNIVVAYYMLHADQDNINIRLAYLHVLVDLFGSVIAIISGLTLYIFGWVWVDSVASLLLGMFVLRNGYMAITTSLRSKS